MTNLDSVLKRRNITLLTKVHRVKITGFPVVMYGCETCTINKAEHWRIDAFQLWCWRTLESPLDSKEIKLVNPKESQPLIFIGSIDAEAEAPILWPRNVKNQLIGKDPDAGKDWRQEEKGVTEDEITSWMASLTQWTWVWADSRRYWRTGKLGMLWFIGSQSDMT